MRKVVIVYFVLINLAGFTLALLDGSHFDLGTVPFSTDSSDIRMLTLSAFGGSTGVYLSYLISDNSGALRNGEFVMALRILIFQNLVSLVCALRSFGRKRKAANYDRTSLSLK